MTEEKRAGLSAVLARRRALEDKKDEIASMVVGLDEWPSASQLQGLRTAAIHTDSAEEVKIFIQYQIGRKQITPSFGNALLEKIQALQRSSTDPKLSIEMVRHFLGNVARYGKYQEFLKEGRARSGGRR